MIIPHVKWCMNELAIRRLKYILRNQENSFGDAINENTDYILFYNTSTNTTILLSKKRDEDTWIGEHRCNYTIPPYIYCLLAARRICGKIRFIVNGDSDKELLIQAKTLIDAGYKFKMVDRETERCDAFSFNDNIDDIICKFTNFFIIEQDNRKPIEIKMKK